RERQRKTAWGETGTQYALQRFDVANADSGISILDDATKRWCDTHRITAGANDERHRALPRLLTMIRDQRRFRRHVELFGSHVPHDADDGHRFAVRIRSDDDALADRVALRK